MTFATLPANCHLVRIDENDSEPIETRLSEPEIVLGFIVTEHQTPGYFSVRPVTPFGVYDEVPQYALIWPDGKVYLKGMDNRIFRSLDDLKQYLRHDAAELYKELTSDARKTGDRKDAAMFSRIAKKLQRMVEEDE